MTAHVLPPTAAPSPPDVTTYYSAGRKPVISKLESSIVVASISHSLRVRLVGNVVRMIDPREMTPSIRSTPSTGRAAISRAVATLTNGLVRYTNDTYFDANNKIVRGVVDNRNENGLRTLHAHHPDSGSLRYPG